MWPGFFLTMKRTRLQAAALGGTPDDVEQAFYEAMRRGDLAQMMACWAEEDEVVCIHPGGMRVVGIGAIRASFEALFAQGPVQVYPQQVHRIDALASAVHHLLERVQSAGPEGQTGWAQATNVYHKTAQGWRLVAHHASPASDQGLEALPGASAVLH